MMSTNAPDWFSWAMAQPRRSHFATTNEGSIHYASWNADDHSKPGLLFAHGFLGQSHWWDFIAPFFTEHFRVFALDFSGMGRSVHRAQYSADYFVDDLAAVIQSANIEPCTVVGHSFGGSRLLHACTVFPALIRQAIILDSYFPFEGDTLPDAVRREPPRPYSDLATAIERFRLIPEQQCEPWLLGHLARSSLRQTEAGWTWLFDPMLRNLQPIEGNEERLKQISMPVAYVHAEMSDVVSAERARRIVAAIPNAVGPITIPQARHHMMLDQPLALVGVLRALLAGR